jgi:hypothetical protein
VEIPERKLDSRFRGNDVRVLPNAEIAIRAVADQGRTMSDEHRAPRERSKAFVAGMGIAALLAWFALLYFMFGDVL